MHPRLTISGDPLGEVNGRPIERYTLSCGSLRVQVLTYGGIIQPIEAPDRNGRTQPERNGWLRQAGRLRQAQRYVFGALIGRFANRIARGRFKLDGVACQLPINDGENWLQNAHCGRGGVHGQ